MSLRVRLSLSSFFLLFLIILSGCGGGGSGAAGPINGPFSNSTLSGSYTFAFTGVNQFGFLAVAGSFQANGSGAITGGTADINSGNGIFTNQAIAGTYNVHNNGQGSLGLTTNAGVFDLDFVLLSSQRALVIRFDNNSTASGVIILQDSSAFSLAALAGTFALNLSGVDVSGTGADEVSGGVLTVDSSGNLTSGVQDTNDNGTVSTNVAMTPAAAAMSAPANGRGTLTITAGSTRHFVYYVANANELMLLETDSSPALGGGAFRQTSTAVSGSFAFTVAGASNGGVVIVVGGIINTDGAGNVLNSSTEDANNGGTISQNVALSGTYSVAANGRGTLSLNGGTVNFAIYPSSAGIQVVGIDNNSVTSGAAFQQSGPFSNSTIQGNYGQNFTGVVSNSAEIDSVAQFKADGGGHVSGAIDFNNGGSLNFDVALSGTYSVSNNGRGTGVFQSNLGNQNLIFYVVSSTRVLFIEVDSNLPAVGEMDHQ